MHVTTGNVVSTDAGHQILGSLFDIVSELKHRASDREDPATVFILRHLTGSTPLRVSDLAGCVRLDASTVSRHVKQLDDAGHLTRIEDPDDRRASRLMITEQGQALLDEAMGARAAALSEGMEGWSAEDRAALSTLLATLARAMDRTHKDTESTA